MKNRSAMLLGGLLVVSAILNVVLGYGVLDSSMTSSYRTDSLHLREIQLSTALAACNAALADGTRGEIITMAETAADSDAFSKSDSQISYVGSIALVFGSGRLKEIRDATEADVLEE